MSIGLECSLSRHRGRHTRTTQPTVREVCLLGHRSRRVEERVWMTGQRVTVLGRGYQVVATSEIPSERSAGRSAVAATHRYIHLATADE